MRSRALFLFISLSALASGIACAPAPDPDGPCPADDGLPPPSAAPEITWHRLGDEVEVEVVFAAFDRCASAATGATVAVADRNGTPIGATAELIATLPPTARIRFQPTQAGTFQIDTHFEPALGSLSTSALVVHGLSSSAPIRVPSSCERISVLPSGAVLCDHKRYRGQTLESECGAACRYVVAGNVVWEHTPNSITRFEDSASGPLTVTATLTATQAPLAIQRHLAATPEALFVLTHSGLQRFSFVVDELVKDGQIESLEDPQAMLIDGSTVQVLLHGTGPSRICAFTTRSSGLTPGPCTTQSRGRLAGVDRQGFWSAWQQSSPSGVPVSHWFSVVSAENGQLVETSRQLLPRGYFAYTDPMTRTTPPVRGVGAEYFAPRVRNGAIELEDLGLADLATTYGATSEFAWVSREGETLIYPRLP